MGRGTGLSRSRQPAPGDASSVPLRARERAPRMTGRGGMGQPKAGSKGEFSDATKLLIRKRAGRGDIYDACCESCGAWLGPDGGEFSHRDARGMGGSKDPVVNGPAGGTLACGSGALRTGCHGLCEDRDADMNGMGFWLKNGEDPLTTPIMLYGKGGGGITAYLAADGIGLDGTGYLYQRPQAVAA